MVEPAAFPALREELTLFPAPVAKDGTPVWTLHDPPANKFYHIGWVSFEVLSRWSLGSVEKIVNAVNNETTLQITDQDVAGIISFLEKNFLFQTISSTGSARLEAARVAGNPGWMLWLLKNYLFIRIPIVRPEQFLKAISPVAELFFSRVFFGIMVLVMLGAFYLVSQQWESFLHSFTAYSSLDGIITVACAIAFAKIFHELGHAVTAHHYGCRIPSMGIALVVMAPMLYTDTNEAWKLTSKSQRMAVGFAGIAAELLLAVTALWFWLLLPDGPLRGAAFVLATTTWIMTVALNASPFMRFDGYFILSDYLGFPNLHERSFSFGRWWLRERMFGLQIPPPEPLSRGFSTFLVLFAYLVWVYRLVVFFGIALLVYHYFFKALGIFLFAVEVGWFIAFPMFKEIREWHALKGKIKLNFNTVTVLFLFTALLLYLVIPIKGTVTAPATLSAVRVQQISAPFASLVTIIELKERQKVNSGETLLKLYSPEMDNKLKQIRTSTEVSRWQATQQVFDEKLLRSGNVLQRRYEAGSTELSGLKGVMKRLNIDAPFDGVVVSLNDEITSGSWLSRNETLLTVADTSSNRVDAYVSERELGRVKRGAVARFIPDVLEYGVFNCRVAEFDTVNNQIIEEPFLASTYGGAIAARNDAQGVPLPDAPLFRVRMEGCTPDNVPPLLLRGVVHLEAESESIINSAVRSAYSLFVRESGF